MSETLLTTSLPPSLESTREWDKDAIIEDFKICCLSREVSLLARREVLTGKAKFGIMGDGKEVPQVALARVFRHGDFRSGYYRDQTFMFALGLLSVEGYFSQLYADTQHDAMTGGRQMNCHFSTPLIDEQGQWLEHTNRYNVSADIAPTAGQMARALGLALASKKYRSNPALSTTAFSRNGQEISFCTIGDASTSEGVFWETINAAVVQQVPLAVVVWDDGYGISVPKEYQTALGSISQALSGMDNGAPHEGLAIHTVKGWDYEALRQTFTQGTGHIRRHHQPALFHIQELTQPQGHSTSGSHERYKSKDRLEWEKQKDCIVQMEQWMIAQNIASPAELEAIRKEAKIAAHEVATKLGSNSMPLLKHYCRRYSSSTPH
ncbi:MAG: thiamine pyrophosphate-dependent dehydrogenase E1 component subunit alpha [Saprospiraceae bacterium]